MAFTACAVLAMALLVGVSEGYQNGARMTTDGPMEAMKSYCTTGNLRPGHGSMPQHTAAPFELIIAGQANNYRPKTPVEILLRAKPGKTFKGFFITADGSSSAGAVSGTWNMATPASNITKFCGITGMTHTTNNTKTEVKVMWTPPEGYHYGTIQFKATVVVNYNTFWTGVLSRPLSPPAGVMSQEDKMKQDAAALLKKFQAQASQWNMRGAADILGMMNRRAGMQRQPAQPPQQIPGNMGGATGNMDFSALLQGVQGQPQPPQGGQPFPAGNFGIFIPQG